MNNKIIRIMLAAALTAVGISAAGCGDEINTISSGDDSVNVVEQADINQAADKAEADNSSENKDLKKLKIGYTFWDLPIEGIVENTDNQIKLVADALNVDLEFNPDTEDLSADGVVKAVQRFADEGVDGMIVINFSNESMIDISKICGDAKIPFMQATRTIDDEDIAKEVEKNEYYVGRMHEAEYQAALTVGTKLVDKGCKNFILVAPEHGDSAYEQRANGFRDACEDPSLNIVEELWDMADDEASVEKMQEVIKKHPEADGIFAVRCGFTQYLVEAQKNLGREKMLPIVGIDFDNSMSEYFADGTVVAAAGGHHADSALTLIAMVNYLRGSYADEAKPIDINNYMMIIDGAEQFEDYRKWCLGFTTDFENCQIINPAEAKNLCVDFNPNAKLDDIRDMARRNSLEDVMQRHEGLVK